MCTCSCHSYSHESWTIAVNGMIRLYVASSTDEQDMCVNSLLIISHTGTAGLERLTGGKHDGMWTWKKSICACTITCLHLRAGGTYMHSRTACWELRRGQDQFRAMSQLVLSVPPVPLRWLSPSTVLLPALTLLPDTERNYGLSTYNNGPQHP